MLVKFLMPGFHMEFLNTRTWVDVERPPLACPMMIWLVNTQLWGSFSCPFVHVSVIKTPDQSSRLCFRNVVSREESVEFVLIGYHMLFYPTSNRTDAQKADSCHTSISYSISSPVSSAENVIKATQGPGPQKAKWYQIKIGAQCSYDNYMICLSKKWWFL